MYYLKSLITKVYEIEKVFIQRGEKVKKYYWLKLKDDFFRQKEIKKLRRIAGGDTYTIIYLKMQLLSLKREGKLIYEGIEDTFASELALELDEDEDNVQITLGFLTKHGLLVESDNIDEFLLTETISCIGKESESTERVRKHRAKKSLGEGFEDKNESSKKEPYSNAKRQKMFRAKRNCEKKQHIPFIEDYTNKKRYNGNYYIVLQRDKFKCSLCDSIENLCVHHIDGYDEKVTNNSNENKMITLCRKCHSNVHHNKIIDEDVLNSIGYYDDMENVTLLGNVTVTACNTEIRDKREELEKDKELEKDSSYRQAKEEVVTEVMKFCQKNQYKLKKDDAVQLIETYGSNTLKKAIVTTMSTEAYKNGKINGKNSYLIKVLNDLSSEQKKIVNIKYEKREQSKANFTERDDYDYDALENGLSGIGDKVPDSSSINEFLSKYREE